MSYAIERNGPAATLRVSGRGRDELFRDAVHALLEAIYEASPKGAAEYEGQVLPVQVDGDSDESLLARLLSEVARLAALQDSRLTAPRWLAFDEKRVTANLLLVPGPPARAVSVGPVALRSSGEERTAEIRLSV